MPSIGAKKCSKKPAASRPPVFALTFVPMRTGYFSTTFSRNMTPTPMFASR